MTIEIVNKLEERISILEFKLELVLKLTKNDIDLTLEECKTMVEFAFVMNLKKDEFTAINELVATQIKFLQVYKQKSYNSPRQYPKFEQDIDVFAALSKDEYDSGIWKCVPKFTGNMPICEKIAKINGIHEMFYDQLATEIKKEKNERLDKETKLLNSYKDNKDQITNLYKDIETMNKELQSNLVHLDSIIEFFNKNDLKKISFFYNSELWERTNEDKQVYINENSYIHNVCKHEKDNILNTLSDLLKNQKCEYREIMIHLLKSGPTSSKKIENLQAFYKTMSEYNKNEHVQIDEIIGLKEKLKSNILIVDDLLSSYHDYSNNL